MVVQNVRCGPSPLNAAVAVRSWCQWKDNECRQTLLVLSLLSMLFLMLTNAKRTRKSVRLCGLYMRLYIYIYMYEEYLSVCE